MEQRPLFVKGVVSALIIEMVIVIIFVVTLF